MVFIVVAHVVVIGCNKDIQYFLPHNQQLLFTQTCAVLGFILAKHIHSTCSALLYYTHRKEIEREGAVENVFKVFYWIIFVFVLLIKKGELPSLKIYFSLSQNVLFVWKKIVMTWGIHHVLENRLAVLMFNAHYRSLWWWQQYWSLSEVLVTFKRRLDFFLLNFFFIKNLKTF